MIHDNELQHLKETWQRIDESVTMNIVAGQAEFTGPDGKTATVPLKGIGDGAVEFEMAAQELGGVTGEELSKIYF